MRKNWVTGITAIRGLATLTFLLLSSGPAVAKTVSTGDKVVAAESSARLRVCYYQDQAYSIGAVLNVEGVLLECVAEKSFETNGALKWQQIKIKDEPKS
ncbi:DUF1496 domain-containing protein [Vibrio vulnificus]|uniref:DUF1496 domain-containing protein n=1 Tax=Vibrio vulnificus TaxID=672 RepID=UPI003ED86AF5